MQNFKHICVIGLGYIGLPTAATFAAHGVKVTGVDVNQHAVDMINQGKVHIVEPDLDALVRDVVARQKLSAQLTPVAADAYIVAVHLLGPYQVLVLIFPATLNVAVTDVASVLYVVVIVFAVA